MSNYDAALNTLPELAEKMPVADEKFLFFFDPQPINFDEKFLFGMSLKTGVYIFSGITCLQALSTFFDIFRTETFWLFIVTIIAFLIYVIISLYAFLSAYLEKYSYARVSYFIISIIFILEAIKYAAKSVYKIIEFITPWDGDFLKLDFIIYVLGYGAYLFIYLYFIYILYRFMIEGKKGKSNNDNNKINNNDEELGNSESQNLINNNEKIE